MLDHLLIQKNEKGYMVIGNNLAKVINNPPAMPIGVTKPQINPVTISFYPVKQKILPKSRILLSDQGSNLDFTDPESVVLPITPSDNCAAKLAKFSKFLRYQC